MILQPHVLDYWRDFNPALGTETPQLVGHHAVALSQCLAS